MAEFAEEARDGRAGEVLRRGDAEFSREVFADAREKDEPSARGAGVSRGGVGARGGAAVGGDARGGVVRASARARPARVSARVIVARTRASTREATDSASRSASASISRRRTSNAARALFQGVHARARDARDALESFALVALKTLGPDRV